MGSNRSFIETIFRAETGSPTNRGEKGYKEINYTWMFVTELARNVNRTPETIKRWIAMGFLECERDEHNRRVFHEEHVERCHELARLGLKAQVEQRSLSDLVAEEPEQLPLVNQLQKRRRGSGEG